MEKVLEILARIRPDLDFEEQERLIDDGILDSFDVLSILSEVNDAFEININIADVVPDNFNNAPAIWRLVERYKS